MQVAVAALKQANNSLNLAVQLLQEQPDLVELAARVSPKDEVALVLDKCLLTTTVGPGLMYGNLRFARQYRCFNRQF